MVMTKGNLRTPPKWTPKVMEAVNSSMHEDTIVIYYKAFELTTVKWFNFEDDCT
jgi:hypothetical protein